MYAKLLILFFAAVYCTDSGKLRTFRIKNYRYLSRSDFIFRILFTIRVAARLSNRKQIYKVHNSTYIHFDGIYSHDFFPNILARISYNVSTTGIPPNPIILLYLMEVFWCYLCLLNELAKVIAYIHALVCYI